MNNRILKVFLVDDEEDALLILEKQLQRIGNIDVIDKAASVDEAFHKIIQQSPDIIFLDIQMPGKDGFELVKALKRYDLQTTIIFVTAHNEFAIQAIKVAAFDYLLKPIIFEELKESIYRYQCKNIAISGKKEIALLLQTIEKQQKLCFNTRTGYIYIKPKEIVYCRADINYTDIFLGKDRKEVVTLNIGTIEQMLDKQVFFRLSRSYIINLDYLIKADRKSKNCELYKNGERFIIPAPRKQIHSLENFIHSKP